VSANRRHSDHCRTPILWRVAALMIVALVPLKAYADPGSGLLLWQIVGAFFVGCGYQIRKFLLKIRKKK